MKRKRKSEQPEVRDVGYRDSLTYEQIEARNRRAELKNELWQAERRLALLVQVGGNPECIRDATKIVNNLKEQLKWHAQLKAGEK